MPTICRKCSGPALRVLLLAALALPAAHAADESAAALAAPLEQAAAAAPEDPALQYLLAARRAASGDADGALALLERTLALGEGFLPTAALFPTLAGDARFRALRERFEARLPRKVDGEVVFTLSDRELLPEGIAYDPVERVFYVGGAGHHGIYRVVTAWTLRPLSNPQDKLDAVLGIAVDAKRRLLYAVTTSALTEAGRARRRNALVVYDLRKWKLVRTLDVPGAQQLNDVALTPDGGTLLVTDSGGGGVWRVDAESGRVDALIPLGQAPGANGIAVPPRGGVAYVAASRRPLRVDLRSGEATPLALPPRENAALIDGLYWHDGALIGVQNVTTPARVIRMRLTDDGRGVTAVETLQSHHQSAFDEPTTAAVAPDGLYVLARTEFGRLNAKGEIQGRETLQPPLVLRVPLR